MLQSNQKLSEQLTHLTLVNRQELSAGTTLNGNQKQHLFNGSTVQTLSDSKGRKVFCYKSTLGPFFKSF